MRKINIILVLLASVALMGCNDYLQILPKGVKIPTTFEDYEAFIRNETNVHVQSVPQAMNLLNDSYQNPLSVSDSLVIANYYWKENVDRIFWNKADESTYYYGYRGLNYDNLIIKYAPEASTGTDAQKNELVAQAKVLRAMEYYILANYYADTYSSAYASDRLSVPYITSPDVNAPFVQVTIEEIYQNMLRDIEEALPALNETSSTIIHPTKGAAYALRARIHLQMSNYRLALADAEEALRRNDQLFDWVDYYNQYKDIIDVPNDYTTVPSPMGYDYVENYYFRHGNRSGTNNAVPASIRVDRAERFEDGDASRLVRWKFRDSDGREFYNGIASGHHNDGGLTTTEMYLIKAECLARSGQYGDAMTELNKVREKRLLNYTPRTATDEATAIEYIRRTKDDAMLFSIVPFADHRRYNLESAYARTFSKTDEGISYSLSPTSHLWTMPFPEGAIKLPGNGTLRQNVSK